MTQPEFLIDKTRRTEAGSLEMSVLQQVRGILLQGGFVLLPSDTCYSLGTLPIEEATRTTVDAILDRKLGPISLAFGSYPQVRKFVDVDGLIALLLEHFTPGPITIVCKAKDAVVEDFLFKTIGSPDRTIGVRIPDSHVEREIADCTENPLMTVAVRDANANEIRNFEQALNVVSLGIAKLGGASWAAIEGGTSFRESHSTVIRVSDLDQIELIREGAIPFEKIQNYITDNAKKLINFGKLSRVTVPSSPTLPTAVQPMRASPSQEPSTKHREWFWGAFALGSTLLGLVSPIFFVAFFICCAKGIYDAPWFKAESRDQRLVNKGIILTVVSFAIFYGAQKFSALTKTAGSAETAPSPTPTPIPSPIPATTAQPAAVNKE